MKNNATETYEGKIGDFKVYLSSAVDCPLKIELNSTTTMEEYEVTIEFKFIQSNPNYSLLFETPFKLMTEICSQIQKRTIRINHGVIEFQVEVPIGKSIKSIPIKLETNRKNLTKEALLDKRLMKLQTELKAEQQKSHKLELDTGVMKKQIQQLQMHMREQLQINKDVKKEANQLKLQVANFKQLYFLYRQQNQHLLDFVKANKQYKIFKEQTERNTFVADYFDPHFIKFEKNGNKIKKIADDAIYQNIFGKKILPNSVSSYSARQCAGDDHCIMYGISTDAIRGVNSAYANKEGIFFKAADGCVWANGTKAAGSHKRAVLNGDVVEVRTNTVLWLIEWYRNGVKLGQCSIPNYLRDKQLYEVIMMHNARDQIELI